MLFCPTSFLFLMLTFYIPSPICISILPISLVGAMLVVPNKLMATTAITVIPQATHAHHLLGLDSDTFYIYHVAAVMVDNLRRLLLGINLSDKAIMDFDFPGVGFPV